MIAITGSIGAGKSYISKIFEELGVPVFNADKSASVIMNNDFRTVLKITSLFGREIYDCGELDKKALGDIIFNDKKKLEQLEAIVHPAVLKSFMDWKYNKIYEEKFSFVMMENAVITKSKTYKLFDYVIAVDAPFELRKKRVLARPGMTEEKMNSILSQQDDTEVILNTLLSNNVYAGTIFNNENQDVRIDVERFIEFFKVKFSE